MLHQFSPLKFYIVEVPFMKDSAVNTLHPICSVSTICHQVFCMYWGHLSLFYRGMSLLNWYKMVSIGDLPYLFIQIKSTNMSSMYLQSGLPCHIFFNNLLLFFNTEPYCLYFILCLCISMMLKMWLSWGKFNWATLDPLTFYLASILQIILLPHHHGCSIYKFISSRNWKLIGEAPQM